MRSPAPCILVSSSQRWRGKRVGGLSLIGRGRLPVLRKEVEARSVFPLGTGRTNVGHRNPGPPDSEVGGPDYSDLYSTLHVPAGTLVQILSLLREAAANSFKRRLRLDPGKAFH